MDSSDEASDAEHLLLKFQQSRRLTPPQSLPLSSPNAPTSSHHLSIGGIENESPKRRPGRPKKVRFPGGILDSPNSHHEIPRRHSGRPKKVLSSDPEDSPHETPRKRAGRPKKALSTKLGDSKLDIIPRRPGRPGRPKKAPVIIELSDSDSHPVRDTSSKRHLHLGSSIHSLSGSLVQSVRSRGPHTNHLTQENSTITLHASSMPPVRSSTGSAGSSSHLNNVTSSRSRRSRPQVENYYSNSNYTGYNSDSDADEGATNEPPITKNYPPFSHHRSSLRSLNKKEARVIYNANGLCISRNKFSALQDIPNLSERVPYCPQNEPSMYAKRFENDAKTPLLHVSFSDDEISAMVALLSPYGADVHLSEMSPADQVIHIVQSMHERRLKRLVKHITKLIRSQKNLVGQDSDGPDTDSVKSQLVNLKSVPNPSYLSSKARTFRSRRKEDIRAFIQDAKLGNIPTRPFYITANQEHVVKCKSRKSIFNMDLPRQSVRTVDLRRTYTWKGASNDVLNLAWSPDGTKFAVGAAAQCDVHNMQYNRSNNLILGDCMRNSIRELPDHRVPFPMVNPPNTHLYMSVTAVQWYENNLYTASYDKTVKIWDVSSYSSATCKHTLRQNHKVQIMARAHVNPGLLATGTESTLHLWHLDADQTCHELDFMKQRLVKNPRMVKDANLMPSSLAWGLSSTTQDLFVAGFAGRGYHESVACREGLLSMWKIGQSSIEPMQLQPNSQNVFDVKFHPTLPWLGTGSSVSALGTNGGGKNIRSLVRIYEPLNKARCGIEFDCPALDINDVTFCPMGRFYISASCTDGVTYVWDHRNPSRILHKLSHGDALNQLDEELTREQADVGVRVALWGKSIDEFVTGGSDGVLSAWNILLAPEDVHVRDIAVIKDEVMSGAFSPDKSSLLIGDAAGGIHLLQPDLGSDPVEDLAYEYGDGDSEYPMAPSDSGRSIGRNLLNTKQLVQHPKYGVGKGPAYKGPYAAWARPNGTPDNKIPITPLLREIQALQLNQPSHDTGIIKSEVAVDEHRKLAEIRNKDPSARKRKDHSHHRSEKKNRQTDIIDLCSDKESEQSKPQIWVDLTSDLDVDNDNEDMSEDDDDQDSDWDVEDHWFPDSREIDPNIRRSE